jgi:hypothetical protein
MFCPICRAEYRLGFTKCADCGVDLVEYLPAEEAATDEDVPRNSEGLELLWSGVSQAISDRIHDDLDAAQIVHKVTEKDFGLLPNLAQSIKFVWIDPRDRASSRSILGKILTDSGATEQGAELIPSDTGRVNPFGLGRKVSNQLPYYRSTDADDAPFESVSLVESDAPSEPVPDDIVEDFDPDDATAEAWSGDDHEMAKYLKLCLSGVGIGCVLREDGAKTHVFVLPAEETRAREVVREVVEATPPE